MHRAEYLLSLKKKDCQIDNSYQQKQDPVFLSFILESQDTIEQGSLEEKQALKQDLKGCFYLI